jgi:hypothetical protein
MAIFNFPIRHDNHAARRYGGSGVGWRHLRRARRSSMGTELGHGSGAGHSTMQSVVHGIVRKLRECAQSMGRAEENHANGNAPIVHGS